MSLFEWMGKGIGKDVAEPIKAIGDLYTTDKARIEAQTKLEEQMQKAVLSQAAINQTFASSAHLFNSGWQPLIGWTSGFLILIYWLPQLVLANYLWMGNCLDAHKVLDFPIKPTDMMNLIYLLFGFGGYTLIQKKIT